MSTGDKNRFKKTYSFFRQPPVFASGGGGGGGGGGGTSVDQFWYSTTDDSIYTTGSVIIRGEDAGLDSPLDKGADVFFYVSGSVNALASEDRKSVFGGDVVVSGSLFMSSSILPMSDMNYNLGSETKRWSNIYTGDLHLRNDRGNWTIVEEKEYLCVVNNLTGKKYKMMLQPLDETTQDQ